MKLFLPAILFLAFAATSSVADGHGTSIHVEAMSGKLVVSDGDPDLVGFAPMIFVESTSFGDGEELELDPYGDIVLWDTPGFDITGLANESSLSLEVLLQPVANGAPPPQRTLWFWNSVSQVVEPANPAALLHLLARDNRSRTLAWDDAVAPAPLLLTDDLTNEQYPDNHSLLAYALEINGALPPGAYGFFARLHSDNYAPSDPILIVLNRNVAYSQMIPAALAINAAAKTAVIGDYDGNGHVEPADYDYWKARFGNAVAPNTSPDGSGNGIVDAADYTIWRNAFAEAGAGSSRLAVVPEPAACALLVVLFVAYGSCRRFRGGGTPNPPCRHFQRRS